jgi:hypothetical protein
MLSAFIKERLLSRYRRKTPLQKVTRLVRKASWLAAVHGHGMLATELEYVAQHIETSGDIGLS